MRWIARILIISISFTMVGCAYRHYMGFHGPSVKRHPETHAGIKADKECLGCHHPDRDPEGPPTTHPNFTGCIKCHNDDLK